MVKETDCFSKSCLISKARPIVVVKDFITTPPLMHRHSENMTRPPVPKPPATTPDSPDSPARRHETHDRQDWEGLGNRSLRLPKGSQVLSAHQGELSPR